MSQDKPIVVTDYSPPLDGSWKPATHVLTGHALIINIPKGQISQVMMLIHLLSLYQFLYSWRIIHENRYSIGMWCLNAASKLLSI